MKRFAILDAEGLVLNIVEFETPVKSLPWPGFGTYWICTEDHDFKEEVLVPDKMKFIKESRVLNMLDKLNLKTLEVEYHKPVFHTEVLDES